MINLPEIPPSVVTALSGIVISCVAVYKQSKKGITEVDDECTRRINALTDVVSDLSSKVEALERVNEGLRIENGILKGGVA